MSVASRQGKSKCILNVFMLKWAAIRYKITLFVKEIYFCSHALVSCKLAFRKKMFSKFFSLLYWNFPNKYLFIYFKISWPSQVFIPENISNHMSTLSRANRSTYWVVCLKMHFHTSTLWDQSLWAAKNAH